MAGIIGEDLTGLLFGRLIVNVGTKESELLLNQRMSDAAPHAHDLVVLKKYFSHHVSWCIDQFHYHIWRLQKIFATRPGRQF